MSVLTTIDGIPLFSSIQEALNWANQNGLSGYHTHDYQGTMGYMGGIDHNNSITGNAPAQPFQEQPSALPQQGTPSQQGALPQQSMPSQQSTPPQQTNTTTNTGY
tara:strand:+ start:6813 stop:7127 length:315 start_codon:yes stop_codon:yes gene_type:complete